MRCLHQVSAENFLTLKKVKVDLHDLSVLVGPNGAGKSNFLKIIQFLGDTARLDLAPAIESGGGFKRLLFRGERARHSIKLTVKAKVTRYASDNATDDYTLTFWRRGRSLLRNETFTYKRIGGRGRRITARGGKLEFVEEGQHPQIRALAGTSAVLSTLPRLGKTEGADQIDAIAKLFLNFRVFEVNVDAARRPAAYSHEHRPVLRPDASNLAAFLRWLSTDHEEVFELLNQDLRYVLPGLKKIHFEEVGGSTEAVAVTLKERGLKGRTDLGSASFGTVRALALLAMLHDPFPPKLTCVEEIDHGLHPYALDRIVERLRDAKRRTQLLIATHSPALVNRLRPSELIVCERNPKTGATRLPAIDPKLVAAMARQDDLSLGELWFSGALGGVPS